MTTFSIRASITAPGDYDRTNGRSREMGRPILSPEPACGRQAKEPTRSASGVEGSFVQVDPSPRLRLGTFNGRRPTRESLIGNGGGAPPVSRFLYRPHYRRIKSESQDYSKLEK